jgi:transketolase
VIDATDSAMLASILPQLVENKGLTYLRICRKNCVAVYSEDSTFEQGKANVLRDGKDVAIIACGYMVAESLKAAEMLAKEGIDAAVIDMWTIKPLDEAVVLEYAKKCGAVVTAENGNVVGGLGAAVAEVLGENLVTPLAMVGIRDRFGQVGTVDFLAEEYGLTAAKVVEAAKKTIARK